MSSTLVCLTLDDRRARTASKNVCDRSDATTEKVLPDLPAPTFAERIVTAVAKDAVLVRLVP